MSIKLNAIRESSGMLIKPNQSMKTALQLTPSWQGEADSGMNS